LAKNSVFPSGKSFVCTHAARFRHRCGSVVLSAGATVRLSSGLRPGRRTGRRGRPLSKPGGPEMRPTKKATAATVASKQNKPAAVYQHLPPDAREKSLRRIAQHRVDVPKAYRGIYDRAMSGRSLRAAVNSTCLECVQWQRAEVRLCPSYACPLWPYRPYTSAQNPHHGPDFAPESPNAGRAGL